MEDGRASPPVGFFENRRISARNGRPVQGGTHMRQRTFCSIDRSVLCGTLFLGAALAGSSARADGIFSIPDLGTLSGQSSSVATSINNQGQVVGISYNSSDGSFASGLTGPAAP